ncbi:hypothetical protein NQD34_015236 [Periophthalmus magnuspinnatus]|nr:hypothetical protein NQD34_015236 [Periophthalmus magnuspinnatus]
MSQTVKEQLLPKTNTDMMKPKGKKQERLCCNIGVGRTKKVQNSEQIQCLFTVCAIIDKSSLNQQGARSRVRARVRGCVTESRDRNREQPVPERGQDRVRS